MATARPGVPDEDVLNWKLCAWVLLRVSSWRNHDPGDHHDWSFEHRTRCDQTARPVLARAHRFYHDQLGSRTNRGARRWSALGLRIHRVPPLRLNWILVGGVDASWLRGDRSRPGCRRPFVPASRRSRPSTRRPSAVIDQRVTVPNNYHSKGTGKRGVCFYDTRATCSPSARQPVAQRLLVAVSSSRSADAARASRCARSRSRCSRARRRR